MEEERRRDFCSEGRMFSNKRTPMRERKARAMVMGGRMTEMGATFI